MVSTPGPFRLTHDRSRTFQHRAFRRAVDSIRREILAGCPVILIAGVAGVGKTALLSELASSYESSTTKVIILLGAQVDGRDLIRLFATAAGMNLPDLDALSEADLHRLLSAHLHNLPEGQASLLVIADDVDKLRAGAWETLVGLTRSLSFRGQVTLVAASTPPFVEPAHRLALQIEAMDCFQINLSGLTEQETREYFNSKLEEFDAEDIPSLDTSAWKELHRNSRGIPQLINQIGGRLLLDWSEGAKEPVDLQQVLDIVEELKAEGIFTGPRSEATNGVGDVSRRIQWVQVVMARARPWLLQGRRQYVFGAGLAAVAALAAVSLDLLPGAENHLWPGGPFEDASDSETRAASSHHIRRSAELALVMEADPDWQEAPASEIEVAWHVERTQDDKSRVRPADVPQPAKAPPPSAINGTQPSGETTRQPRETSSYRLDGARRSAGFQPIPEETRKEARIDPIEKRQQAEIGRLLDEMEMRLKRDHLTTPVGNSAWDRAQSVLDLDPDNSGALAVRGRIVERYLVLAQAAFDRSDDSLAERLLDRAASVDAEYEAIARMRERNTPASTDHASLPPIEVAILPSRTAVDCPWPVDDYLSKVARRIVENEPRLKLRDSPAPGVSIDPAFEGSDAWWTADGEFKRRTPQLPVREQIAGVRVLVSSWIDCPRDEAVYQPWRRFKIAFYDLESARIYADVGTIRDIEATARELVDAYLDSQPAARTTMAGS